MGESFYFVDEENKVIFYLCRNLATDFNYEEVNRKFQEIMQDIEYDNNSDFEYKKLPDVTLNDIVKLVSYYKSLSYLSYSKPATAIIISFLKKIYPKGKVIGDYNNEFAKYESYKRLV